MWQFQGNCYGSALAANKAAASAVSGTVSNGSVITVTAVTDSSITYLSAPLDGSASHTLVVPLEPQECGLLTAQDATEIGWLLIGAWVATYAVRYLATVVDRSLNGASNDA